MISTGPNGPETPATAGLAYERLKIPSGSRLLDAYIVEVPSTCQSRAALFIFYGVGETISQWVSVQRLLHDHCVSSVVFDYSGNGDSSPPGTVRNLDQDALAAYALFHTRFAAASPVCTLGFSMGRAVLLDAYTVFHPALACMIVGGARALFTLGAFRDGWRMRFPTGGTMLRPSLIAILRCWCCIVMMMITRIQSGWLSASTRLRSEPEQFAISARPSPRRRLPRPH